MNQSKYTGSHSLLQSLEHEGVETIFGVPGGAILPAYDPLLDSPIRHVLARHEQGAGHMAEGYAMATGRVGVAFVTSGPGATNLITPLQNAMMDSTPLVAISGQVPTTAIGSDAFQEAYTTGLAMHCTKHSYLVTDADDIPAIVHEAFHLASTGRPGPVLVDIPKDVLNQATSWSEPSLAGLPGYKPTRRGHPVQIAAAIELIESAERPVLYVGGGVIKAGASAELVAFAEAANAPVVTTLMARGAIPDGHPLALGMPGMHGVYTATTAIQKSDVLVSVGARFDDRVTGNVEAFAPGAKVVHIDVDPAEIGKVRHADVPIVGDARLILTDLLQRLHASRGDVSSRPERRSWFEQLSMWQAEKPLRYEQRPEGPIKTQHFIERLHDITGGDAVIVAGVGQHQMWASQFWGFERPRSWINSGGLGTMGFAVPAAVGAKLARPEDLVIALDGDGCFQMTFQEMITASVEEVPVKVFVFNNGGYGMVQQWQQLFYGGRLSASVLPMNTPDYPKLAEAMGCVGLCVEDPSDIDVVIEKGLAVDDRPVVTEVVTDPNEMCFPMVPAGGSNDDVALGPEDL
jgi:acetolactate synthase-1/2/3 large subunit